MRAWQVDTWCDPDGITLAEIPIPVPGDHQVLIRNHAAGLNFLDTLLIQGKYQERPSFPFTPGAEVAGTIEAVGPLVSRLAIGDRVLARTRRGGFAELSIADEANTYPVPPGMSWQEAAAFPIVYHTAYYGLVHRGSIEPHEWLLVHAGASGVGMAAVQLGKAMGARVIATAGSREKLDFCQSQGADAALAYREPGWVEQVMQLTDGRGVDIVFDPVGGQSFHFSTKCIASGGRLLVVGFASGDIPTIALNRILLKNISVAGVYLTSYAKESPLDFKKDFEALAALYRAGRIRPAVTKSYPLEAAPAALKDMLGRMLMGKAVLIIE